MSNASGKETACACCGTDIVILACSGASNVGHLSDLAARELTRRGVARMGCLAGVAARAPGTLNALQNVRLIVVLDGCATQCGKRTLMESGYHDGLFLRIDTLGMKRGETPVNEENVQRLASATAAKISEWSETVAVNSKAGNPEAG